MTYYTPDDVLTTTVDSGEYARLTVDYQIAVADKARILDHANPGLAKTTTGEDQELLFRADAKSAQSLRTGDILLAAEGPRTPKGLLRRVVRTEHRKSVLAVETAPAQLQEAMPKAVLRFRAARKGVRRPRTWCRPRTQRIHPFLSLRTRQPSRSTRGTARSKAAKPNAGSTSNHRFWSNFYGALTLCNTCRDWMALRDSLTDLFGIMPTWTSTSPRRPASARCGSV
ncbi:hypothetical protein [Streptomyces sp. NPDC002215]|uniref:hypothetical protein n=1 Tax=Streptomyces sp. NPDC002215 TaxID=3154412 RepID=UPI0033281535